MNRGRLLVVTAVATERQAIERGLGPSEVVTVIDAGVGVASAAAATATALHASGPYSAVVCAGIGGGFTVAAPGLALGTTCVAADLGADSPDGFLSLDELGLGPSTMECDGELLTSMRSGLPDAVPGAILTVATVTGTAERALRLRQRYPGAVAEAMEGFGVATAAGQAGVPFGEVRAISNPVGPRDRAAWRMADALAALESVGSALATLVR